MVANRPFPAGPYAEQARQRLNEIEALAGEQLAAADKLIQEEKFQEAIGLLFEVKRTFAGSRAAAAAEARLQELSKSPALLAATRKAAAEDLLADAKLYMDSGDLLRGVACYKQAAQQYGDTPHGRKAQEALAAFDADEEFQKRLKACEADARCRTLLSLARSYRANRVFDAAKTNYNQVLDQFPDTQFATLASQELKALEEEMEAARH
jgi:outer membrane protein assembly factor BamD (BamD/ComL family)